MKNENALPKLGLHKFITIVLLPLTIAVSIYIAIGNVFSIGRVELNSISGYVEALILMLPFVTAILFTVSLVGLLGLTHFGRRAILFSTTFLTIMLIVIIFGKLLTGNVYYALIFMAVALVNILIYAYYRRRDYYFVKGGQSLGEAKALQKSTEIKPDTPPQTKEENLKTEEEHQCCHKSEEEHPCCHKSEEEHQCCHKSEEEHQCCHKSEEEHQCCHKSEEEHQCCHKSEEEHQCCHKNEEEHQCCHKNEEEHQCCHKSEEEHKCDCVKGEEPSGVCCCSNSETAEKNQAESDNTGENKECEIKLNFSSEVKPYASDDVQKKAKFIYAEDRTNRNDVVLRSSSLIILKDRTVIELEVENRGKKEYTTSKWTFMKDIPCTIDKAIAPGKTILTLSVDKPVDRMSVELVGVK